MLTFPHTDLDAKILLGMSVTDAAKWFESRQEKTAANLERSNAEKDPPSSAAPSRPSTPFPSLSPTLTNDTARITTSQCRQAASTFAEPARVRNGCLSSSMTREGLENVFRWAEGLLGAEFDEGYKCGYADLHMCLTQGGQ